MIAGFYWISPLFKRRFFRVYDEHKLKLTNLFTSHKRAGTFVEQSPCLPNFLSPPEQRIIAEIIAAHKLDHFRHISDAFVVICATCVEKFTFRFLLNSTRNEICCRLLCRFDATEKSHIKMETHCVGVHVFALLFSSACTKGSDVHERRSQRNGN